jgi:hypothetical protein
VNAAQIMAWTANSMHAKLTPARIVQDAMTVICFIYSAMQITTQLQM